MTNGMGAFCAAGGLIVERGTKYSRRLQNALSGFGRPFAGSK